MTYGPMDFAYIIHESRLMATDAKFVVVPKRGGTHHVAAFDSGASLKGSKFEKLRKRERERERVLGPEHPR